MKNNKKKLSIYLRINIAEKLYIQVRRLMYLTLGTINQFCFHKTPLIHILCYHSIAHDNWDFSINPDEFKKQINFLKTRFNFITLSNLSAFLVKNKEIKKPSVIINFDDGYQDIMQMRSFLKSLNIKPTVFIISDIEKANYKEIGTKRKFLSNEEILQLRSDGWEIGSHTGTYPDMNSLNEKQIEQEIINSKEDLERNLKIPINYLAFPKGRYSDTIIKSVKKAKYKLALTMDDGIINHKTNKLKIPRIGVDRTHSFAEFKTLQALLNISARKLIKSLNYGK